MKIGSLYKFRNTYLRCKRITPFGLGIFQKCDSNGNELPPIKKDGLIIDYGGRIVFKNKAELILEKHN